VRLRLRCWAYTMCHSGCGGTEAGRGSESILRDPRVAYSFMVREPEESRKLIGLTRAETAVKLTEWFHDFLEHGKVDVLWQNAFYRAHPYLTDRLRRQSVEGYPQAVYMSISGCWSASALFAELMRSVNIPVRKAETMLEGPSGGWGRHAGLMFDWERSTARYLLHTDDIYCCGGHIKDPAPGPGITRGEALWTHAWLGSDEFGQMFTFDADPTILARATFAQGLRYTAFAAWRTASHSHPSANAAVPSVCSGPRDAYIRDLQRSGLTLAEAEEVYGATEAALQMWGGGDLAAGCTLVKNRHQIWCQQTGKCRGEPGR